MPINELQPTRKPPKTQIGAILWLRENLFSTWSNGLLTFLSLYIIYISIPPLLNWLIFNANFNFGTVNIFGFNIQFSEAMATNSDCGRVGACWPFIYEKFDMFIYGFYPREELWRPNAVFALTALLFVAVKLTKKLKNMSYKVTEEGNIATVHLDGEIDMDVTEKAKEVIMPLIEAQKEVHLNLKEVQYMDSSGISVLIESHQKAMELGTKVILKEISKSVLKVIMMAKLEQILNRD